MASRRRQCELGVCLLAQRSRRLVVAGREQHDARSAAWLSVFGSQIRPLARAHQHRRLQLWGEQSREWRPGRGATFVRGRGTLPHSPALGRDHPGSRIASLLTCASRAPDSRLLRISGPAWRRGLFAPSLRPRRSHQDGAAVQRSARLHMHLRQRPARSDHSPLQRSPLVSADRTGRMCRRVEFDPLYFDVIVRRYEAARRRRVEICPAVPRPGNAVGRFALLTHDTNPRHHRALRLGRVPSRGRDP
jgi:hypothetical protein